jgi:hypothetical protein
MFIKNYQGKTNQETWGRLGQVARMKAMKKLV